MIKSRKKSFCLHSENDFFSWNKFNILYNILCALATIFIIIWWVYKYSLHNLSCSIDIKNFFESEESVQPVFSVCVVDPELDTKLQKASHSKYNKSVYIRFLRGEEYPENLRYLNYSLIRFNWSEYFYKPPQATLIADNGSFLGRVPVSEYWRYSTSFIGLQSSNKYLTDCISFEPLKKKVGTIRVKLNSSIFNHGVRPSTSNEFRVFLHYPGQIIRSYSTLKSTWEKIDNLSSLYMLFRITDVQVLQKYPTRHQKCIGDWRNYDKNAFKAIFEKVGCQAPYQYIYGTNHPLCPTKEKMKDTILYPSNRQMKRFDYPCRSLHKAQYKYSETMSRSLPNGVFEMAFYFTNQYKETKQYEQIDLGVRIGV